MLTGYGNSRIYSVIPLCNPTQLTMDTNDWILIGILTIGAVWINWDIIQKDWKHRPATPTKSSKLPPEKSTSPSISTPEPQPLKLVS